MPRHAPPRRYQLRWHTIAAALLVTIGASCSSVAVSQPAGSPSETPGTSTSATASRTPVPAADLELQGLWTATISTGEDVTLELGPYTYQINEVIGGIVSDGEDRLVFSSPFCDRGPGSYEWSIEDEQLTFVPLEPRDPCAERIFHLEGTTYTRVE